MPVSQPVAAPGTYGLQAARLPSISRLVLRRGDVRRLGFADATHVFITAQRSWFILTMALLTIPQVCITAQRSWCTMAPLPSSLRGQGAPTHPGALPRPPRPAPSLYFKWLCLPYLLYRQCWSEQLLRAVFGRLAQGAPRLRCMVQFGSLPHAHDLPTRR